MNRKLNYWLTGVFLAAFLAIGIPYWIIPYDQVSMPNTFYGIGLFVVTLAAAAGRAFGRVNLVTAMLVAGAAVPAAVIARVAVETTGDPTSHNLWPFEVIIAMVVGMVSSLMGALAGSFPEL